MEVREGRREPARKRRVDIRIRDAFAHVVFELAGSNKANLRFYVAEERCGAKQREWILRSREPRNKVEPRRVARWRRRRLERHVRIAKQRHACVGQARPNEIVLRCVQRHDEIRFDLVLEVVGVTRSHKARLRQQATQRGKRAIAVNDNDDLVARCARHDCFAQRTKNWKDAGERRLEQCRRLDNIRTVIAQTLQSRPFENNGGADAYSAKHTLVVNDGSGDAAEAIPMTVPVGWRDAASKIGFEAALEGHQDLTQQQYQTLHDTGTAQGLRDPEEGFVIQSIGSSANSKFSDEGIEYYRFVR